MTRMTCFFAVINPSQFRFIVGDYTIQLLRSCALTIRRRIRCTRNEDVSFYQFGQTFYHRNLARWESTLLYTNLRVTVLFMNEISARRFIIFLCACRTVKRNVTNSFRIFKRDCNSFVIYVINMDYCNSVIMTYLFVRHNIIVNTRARGSIIRKNTIILVYIRGFSIGVNVSNLILRECFWIVG